MHGTKQILTFNKRWILWLFFIVIVQTSAAVNLDGSNVIGSAGNEHWIINAPGDYLLTYGTSIINTNSNYVILVRSSDVSIDLNGKTITGTVVPDISKPTPVDVPNRTNPSYYGIWAWGVNNVTVKNGTIMNNCIHQVWTGIKLVSSHHNTIINNYSVKKEFKRRDFHD